MASPFTGEIAIVGFNFAPVGWASCDGQTLQISQNMALFTLLGTTYGGNGTSTFQLPNLQSRVPVHMSSSFVIGSVGGTETATIGLEQIPVHNHALLGATTSATSRSPAGNVLAAPDRDVYNGTVNQSFNSAAIGMTGGSQAHNNIQPYLAVTFIIALYGIYPTRS